MREISKSGSDPEKEGAVGSLQSDAKVTIISTPSDDQLIQDAVKFILAVQASQLPDAAKVLNDMNTHFHDHIDSEKRSVVQRIDELEEDLKVALKRTAQDLSDSPSMNLPRP